MQHIPSESISKSVLLATPLFLFVIAVLHSSSELSYLFVLDFVNNVGGTADIVFIPTLQPQIPSGSFYQQLLFQDYNLQPLVNKTEELSNTRIPLVNNTEVNKWVQQNQIVRGASKRWVIPTKTNGIDTFMFSMNISHEIDIGIADQSVIKPLKDGNAAVESSLLDIMGLDIGDKISIEVQPKNILAGMKMFQKYQEASSKTQHFQTEEIDPIVLASYAYDFLDVKDSGITRQQFNYLVELTFQQSTVIQFMVQQRITPQGLYPSQFHNVIVTQVEDFYWLISKWLLSALVNIGRADPFIKQMVPQPYRSFWPNNTLQVSFQIRKTYQKISESLQNWSLMMVCRLNDRQQIYSPNQGTKYQEFSVTLQDIPSHADAIVLYPIFKQSLAIKFFFDSVIQIFEFVSCILYFYTMTLIMKQIYQEKEIQVGIWRTLGAGAVSKTKTLTSQEILKQRKPNSQYQSQFKQELTWKQRFKFFFKVSVKVGFLFYWLIVVALSIVLYICVKVAVYHYCSIQLKVRTLQQPVDLPFIISFIILSFLFVLCLHHIMHIFTNSLSQTIKPVKRTFDVVKVRIIHLATFGVSVEVLMIAVMLIYYGVVSYYWIPFSILDGDQNLQILLLNTIFIFMIFGAIILLSIFQSRLQILIFELIFKVSKPFKCLKSAIKKNIKAKQYKNIKVAIIISVIFAFVLFFTTGINIQIQIIESFIERSLGSDLVFQNYGSKVFDTQKVNEYLDTKEHITYAWLSQRLDRDKVNLQFISPITGSGISAQFQVISPKYLNSTFYEYYFPEQYLSQSSNYEKLPNSVINGFNSIFTGPDWSQSVGKYDPDNTLTQRDPNKINVNKFSGDMHIYGQIIIPESRTQIPPQEQIIYMVVSTGLRKALGVDVGVIYKLLISSQNTGKQFFIRAKIVHSFKQGPGFDILRNQAFITQQQAEYIYSILGQDVSKVTENQKLFIKGEKKDLAGIANKIISMSPQQTQAFTIQDISETFSLMQRYLDGYVIFITVIMSSLAVLFLFLYTIGKCREEAQMYKMLRAIGLSAFRIRMMVFAEIIIRLFVAIFDGILLGIILSYGFSAQVQEFLMLKTPRINIDIVLVIAVILLIIFSVTIILATRYLEKRTVSNTNKKI